MEMSFLVHFRRVEGILEKLKPHQITHDSGLGLLDMVSIFYLLESKKAQTLIYFFLLT